MSNTLILAGGQGSTIIKDTVFHDLTLTPVGQIEVLEAGTGFTTVQLQTKDTITLAFGIDQQVANEGTLPSFTTGHAAGEFISLRSGFERVTGIALSAGKIRIYFT